MRLSRIWTILPALALSACATVGNAPSPAPEVTPKPEAKAPAERAPSAGKGKMPTAPSQPAVPSLPEAGPDNSVFFTSDDARLDERGEQVLRRHAARLKGNPQQVVTLVGYADPLGSRSYNLALTEERLDTVAETLRSLGVGRGQIRRVSAGQVPDGGCDTAACRQRMRRVELIYEK